MKYNVDAFGYNLRKIRERRNMTQRDLSKKSGVTQTTIAKIENNKINPSLYVTVALAEALSISLSTLLKPIE
jgi:transcriptional regulator with XRE-family HTH domain